MRRRLQPDEIVTTGALAPSLPLRAGERCEAMIEGLPLAPLRWVCN
jgi:2-keto-4-pentenoate hydratase